MLCIRHDLGCSTLHSLLFISKDRYLPSPKYQGLILRDFKVRTYGSRPQTTEGRTLTPTSVMLIYRRRHLKVIYEKNLRHKRYLSSALNISFLFFSQDAPGPQVQLLWTRLLLQPPATVFRCLGSYVAQQRVCVACGHTAAISFNFEAWCPFPFDRHKNGARFDDSSKTISRRMVSS